MGSDIKTKFWQRHLIQIFKKIFWGWVIVKSKDMLNCLSLNNVEILPNGVDTSIFKPRDRFEAKKKLGWNTCKTHILFPADPERPEKNFRLLSAAMGALPCSDIAVHTMVDIPHEKVALYFNAADVVVLPSLWEGSPNTIKETMACNCPVVATDVGDIAWLIGDEPGHFLTDFDPVILAEKLRQALEYSKTYGRTKGRGRIFSLKLDADSVAQQLLGVYSRVLS